MKKGPWPGTYKAICDVCGFEFASDKIKDRWDGLKVCAKDWEGKHPQLSIRVPSDNQTPPWVRAEPEDTFIHFCTFITSSCYASLATAGCARAGNAPLTYAQLLEMNGGVTNE